MNVISGNSVTYINKKYCKFMKRTHYCQRDNYSLLKKSIRIYWTLKSDYYIKLNKIIII